MFRNTLECRFVPHQDILELTENLEYYDARSKQLFVIPKGFRWDGASIPQELWILMGHPFSKAVRASSCLHDFLYENEVIPKKKADQMFADALQEEGMEYNLANMFYLGTRLAGRSKY